MYALQIIFLAAFASVQAENITLQVGPEIEKLNATDEMIADLLAQQPDDDGSSDFTWNSPLFCNHCGRSTYRLSTSGGGGGGGGGASSNDDRIINGVYSYIEEDPWTVQVYTLVKLSNGGTGYGRCTGSIINRRYVLTAAHCVQIEGFDKPIAVYVAVGQRFRPPFNLATLPNDPNYIAVSGDPIVHEDYVGAATAFVGDVAVLRLSKRLVYNQQIQPVCLSKNVRDYNYKLGSTTGWGKENGAPSAPVSNVLKRGVLMAADTELCTNNNNYGITITTGHMCGYTHLTYDSTCKGDSGGPFTIVENEQTYQIGVTSFGAGNSVNQCLISIVYPKGLADVIHYMDWIKEKAASGRDCWCW